MLSIAEASIPIYIIFVIISKAETSTLIAFN